MELDAASQSTASPARIECYEQLLDACRARVTALGINYDILDSMAGFARGYATKLLAFSEHNSTGGRRTKRHFSPESFDAYLSALGFDLVLVENEDKVARLRAWQTAKLLQRGGPQGRAPGAVSTAAPVIIKHSRGFMQRIARLGGLARAKKLHARASLSETKRRAALARWHPPTG